MKTKTILFDINETVLSLNQLRPKFAAAFGDENVTGQWFAMLLHASTVCAITGVKTNFKDLSRIALESLAARLGAELTAVASDDILGSFASLQAHPDIKPALEKLRACGFKTVAFSNSSAELIASQIHNAGLENYFDRIISVEGSGTFKPAVAAYQFAASELDLPVENLRLVACHDWDTHGAMNAGLAAAYIDRTAVPYNPLFNKPELVGASMGEVVDQIITQVE